MLGRLIAPCLSAYCAPCARAFAAAIEHPEQAQAETLARIVGACVTTEYGQAVGLTRSMSVDAFRARVPIADYDAVKPWLARQSESGAAAITPGRVRCYEPTSGSGGPAKRIPYNDAMLRAFHHLFAVWAHDLLQHVLKPVSGRAFMSISAPIAGAGFADDRDYLNPVTRMLLSPLLVLPGKTASASSAETFRDALVCKLLCATDMEIISIWNPSYLLVLMEHFMAHRARLLPQLKRASRVLLENESVRWETVWPRLKLISCWTDAAAQAPARRLHTLLPHARLQGKGLIATEAPVSVPLTGAAGCVALADSVFIELEGKHGELCLLHEARADGEYQVIVTQPGGLLRYRLGDLVHVTGHYRGTPLLEFIGRADAVCDLVGEKLSEAFVVGALQHVLPENAFRTLLPFNTDTGTAGYCLLTDAAQADTAHRAEAALQASFRYREARAIGQLLPLALVHQPRMRAWVHAALEAAGIKAGDIKDQILISRLALAKRIHAYVAERAREAA